MSGVITDAVSQVNVLNIGVVAVASLGLVEISMAHSLGLVISNAAVGQKSSQILQNAGVTQCCALMISAGAAGAAA